MFNVYKAVRIVMANDIGKADIEFCRGAGDEFVTVTTIVEDRSDDIISTNFLYGSLTLEELHDFIGALTREFK